MATRKSAERRSAERSCGRKASSSELNAKHPGVEELLKGNGPATMGYYAALGLGFDCAQEDVQKKYKRLALQCHPDKAGNEPEAVERFQAIATAYHVLSDTTATKAYWSMFRLRCYLHQTAHTPDRLLYPYYLMQVKKRDDRGIWQDRLITLDLLAGYLQNWKKDAAHRKIALSSIKAIKVQEGSNFSIQFKDNQRDYRLLADNQLHCELFVSVLRAIVDGVAVISDDTIFPPRCERKGYVEKKGKSGDYSRRWLMLGSAYILIFRNMNCEELVNAISLCARPTVCG